MKQTLYGMALLAMLASSAHAITVVPTGLNAGDQYRLAFLTSTTRDATSQDIADYNAFVTGVANSNPALATLGTTWTAIARTPDIDAMDNTGTNPTTTGVPIYLLNDTKLADDNADLWDGSIDVRLNVTDSGLTPSGGLTVWTGNGLRPLGSITGNGGIGSGNSTSSAWFSNGFDTSTANHRFYALSAVMTVVPVPGAVWLFGSALGVMGWLRRKVA